MKRKRLKIRPFRIGAVFLLVVAVAMIVRFPAKGASLERQRKDFEKAAQAYYDEQERGNQLDAQLAEANTDDFIERIARRDHGYCWYGETIYVVGNLDEIADEAEFDVQDHP